MTLDEMAQFICGKVNQTEAEDILACKGFLRRRYQVAFKDALWKDSIVQIDLTVDPTDPNNATGIVLLPEIVDRVMAVRSTTRALNVQSWDQYFRVDFDAFAKTGDAFEFAQLNPVWFTVRPATNPWTEVALVSLGVSEDQINCDVGDVFRFINNTGQQVIVQTPDNFFVLAVQDGTTAYITAVQTVLLVNYLTPYTVRASFQILNLAAHQSTGAGSTMVVTSASAADTAPVKIIWRDLAGKRYETTAALPLTLTPDDDAGFFEIEALFKPATTGLITATLNDASGLALAQATLAAVKTRSPAFQRIRLFNIPTANVSLKVLAKSRFEALDFDFQEPAINGVENCLLAFGQGDMLQRERQYGKAQQLYQEASLLLEQLKREETVQQAFNQRIMPAGGYGDDQFCGSHGFSF